MSFVNEACLWAFPTKRADITKVCTTKGAWRTHVRRHFVLVDSAPALFCFTREGDPSPRFVLPLLGADVSPVKTTKSASNSVTALMSSLLFARTPTHCLEVTVAEKFRPLCKRASIRLAVDTKRQLDEWCAALKRAAAVGRKHAAVEGVEHAHVQTQTDGDSEQKKQHPQAATASLITNTDSSSDASLDTMPPSQQELKANEAVWLANPMCKLEENEENQPLTTAAAVAAAVAAIVPKPQKRFRDKYGCDDAKIDSHAVALSPKKTHEAAAEPLPLPLPPKLPLASPLGQATPVSAPTPPNSHESNSSDERNKAATSKISSSMAPAPPVSPPPPPPPPPPPTNVASSLKKKGNMSRKLETTPPSL